MAHSSVSLSTVYRKQIFKMFKNIAILFVILASFQSTLGGLLHGETYSAVAAPAAYGYASSVPYSKLAAYSSPIISAPLASSYSLGPYATSYAAAPLTTAYAGRYAAHSGYASAYGVSPLTTTYGAAPIAKYTTSLAAAPLVKSYTSYSAPLIGHGSYAAAPIANYASPYGSAYGTYGNTYGSGYGSAFGGYVAPLASHGTYAATPFSNYAAPLTSNAAYGPIGHVDSLSAW